MNWAFAFSEDVLRYAQRDFYKAIARITRGFLKQEKEILSEGPVFPYTKAKDLFD